MRKTALEKAIDTLEAEKRVIELAIAKLRAASEKKPAARLRRVAVVAEGASK